MARKRKRKANHPLIDSALLSLKTIPTEILQAEKGAELLIGKKLKPKHKASVKFKAAISNYKKAVTRYKRSETLLKKHYKILLKFVKTYIDENTPQQ